MKRILSVATPGILAIFLSSCADRVASGVDQAAAIPLEVHVIENAKVPVYLEVPGTVQSSASIVISVKVAGRIETLPFHEGKHVRKGQLLAEIDSSEAAARVRRAESALLESREAAEELDSSIHAAEAAVDAAATNRDLASATLARYTVLRDRQSVSAQEFDEVSFRQKAALAEFVRARESLAALRARPNQLQARIRQAQADVDVAKVALADYRISSPIDGVVTTRSAEPGMLAAPGMALMAIEDSKHYELQVTVEESQISRLRTGQRAAVRVDSLPQTIQGQLIRTNPVANEATRTYAVTLSLALPGGEAPLRTGSFGRATFILGNEDGVVIPESALVERGQLTGVFYVRDNLALFRLVKSGRRHESGIQILSGLSAGDRILLRPDPGLPDGTRILENNLPGTSQ